MYTSTLALGYWWYESSVQGLLPAVLETFWPVLLFSVGALFLGRVARWPSAHLSLPFLFWALWCALLQYSWFWRVHAHLQELASILLEAALALVMILVLEALVVVFWVPLRFRRLDLICWLSGFLAVSTVVVDGAMLVLISQPLLE